MLSLVTFATTSEMLREIASNHPYVELMDTWTWFQSGIAKELNEMYREWGLLKYRSFGYGHSFGVLCHYYGHEAGVKLREDVDTVLEPNMVVSMEPMVMIPEGRPGAGGCREHDILVVQEDSAENITGFPFGPEHNIVKNQDKLRTFGVCLWHD